MEVPQKTKNRTASSSNSAPEYTAIKKTKTLIGKGMCIPLFIASLFTVAKTWKHHKCLSKDEWIKKLWNVYTCVCLCMYVYIYI